MRVRPLQIQTNVFFHASHFFGACLRGKLAGLKNNTFFSTKHIGGCGTPGTKKSIDRCDPNHAAAVFPGQGGSQGTRTA